MCIDMSIVKSTLDLSICKKKYLLEKRESQTNEKSKYCHIFKSRGEISVGFETSLLQFTYSLRPKKIISRFSFSIFIAFAICGTQIYILCLHA
jgi:hypothetical protein